MNRISVSPGNRKMGGDIPSISFPPLLTCRPGAPCARVCYALKPYLSNRSVRSAWQRNLDMYLKDPKRFFEQIHAYVVWHCVERFRWFVAGDIPDIPFLEGVKQLCRETPDTSHLMFTKRYDLDLDLDDRPPNLNMLFSLFPGLDIPDWVQSHRKAFFQDGTESRTTGKEFVCSGHCAACLYCWDESGDVVFIKH